MFLKRMRSVGDKKDTTEVINIALDNLGPELQVVPYLESISNSNSNSNSILV